MPRRFASIASKAKGVKASPRASLNGIAAAVLKPIARRPFANSADT